MWYYLSHVQELQICELMLITLLISASFARISKLCILPTLIRTILLPEVIKKNVILPFGVRDIIKATFASQLIKLIYTKLV